MQRTTVIHPRHRVNSHGMWLSWDSDYKLLLKSKGKSFITENQQKAIFKTFKSKYIRKIFRFRGSPFVELTKKPAEVRMGKGRGTRIQKKILPLAKGQCFGEFTVPLRTFKLKYLKMWFLKASPKLSNNIKIVTTDL